MCSSKIRIRDQNNSLSHIVSDLAGFCISLSFFAVFYIKKENTMKYNENGKHKMHDNDI